MRVTEAAGQLYYTLTVPTAEQYFANGILHHNSGKTFLIVRQMVIRAIKAPGSRHALLRFRLNAIKSTIIADTFPKVMALAFPEVPYQLNKSDFYATIDRSELWFGGLDDGSDRYTWDVRQEKGEYGVRVEIRPR